MDHLAGAACDFGTPLCSCARFRLLPGEPAATAGAAGVPRSQLLTETIRYIVHRSEEFTDAFYLRLFERHPQIRERFTRLDRPAQRAKLWAALTTLSNAGSAIPGLVQYLGVSHRIEDVQPKDYDGFVAILLETLEQFAGDSWSDQLAEAWTSVMREVADAMIAAGAEGAAKQPSSPHAPA